MSESYEEVLKTSGELVFTPGGVSMMPLLRHHENPVVLVPCSEKLKRGDVPFYKRKNGQYVLHRIIRVKKDGYVLCGDGQVYLEKGVTQDMIFAKMMGFYKDGVFVSVDEPWVKRYAARRMASRPLRYLAARIGGVFRRICKRKH